MINIEELIFNLTINYHVTYLMYHTLMIYPT